MSRIDIKSLSILQIRELYSKAEDEYDAIIDARHEFGRKRVGDTKRLSAILNRMQRLKDAARLRGYSIKE